MDHGTASGIALLIVTILLSLFTIIFAELVPKTLALAHAERFAITLSLPIDFLGRGARAGHRVPDLGHERASCGCSAPRSPATPRSPPRSCA